MDDQIKEIYFKIKDIWEDEKYSAKTLMKLIITCIQNITIENFFQKLQEELEDEIKEFLADIFCDITNIIEKKYNFDYEELDEEYELYLSKKDKIYDPSTGRWV